MANIGIPTSTIGMDIWLDIIDPIVDPLLLSDLFIKYWFFMFWLSHIVLNTDTECASDA